MPEGVTREPETVSPYGDRTVPSVSGLWPPLSDTCWQLFWNDLAGRSQELFSELLFLPLRVTALRAQCDTQGLHKGQNPGLTRLCVSRALTEDGFKSAFWSVRSELSEAQHTSASELREALESREKSQSPGFPSRGTLQGSRNFQVT